MSQLRFDAFKEIIDLAAQNDAPRDTRLILVGRISYAKEVGELSGIEALELETRLGGRIQWQAAYEFAIGSIPSSLNHLPA